MASPASSCYPISMLYLIGGPPRAGKSQFASRVVLVKPMASFSLDFLYNLEQVRTLPGFERAPLLEKGRLFYPTLKEILVDVHRRAEDCVIDGEVILPEFIPELAQRYAIRCCFLGLSATSLETILKHGGYFNWPEWKLQNGLEHEVEDLAVLTAQRSAIIQQEAAKYDLPYFDLAPGYQKATAAALKQLLG